MKSNGVSLGEHVIINHTNCFIFDDYETRNGHRAYIY